MTEPNSSGPIVLSHPAPPAPKRLVVFIEARVGRNQLCPCGSQVKYKKCCMESLLLPEYAAQVRLYEAAYGPSDRRSYYLLSQAEMTRAPVPEPFNAPSAWVEE